MRFKRKGHAAATCIKNAVDNLPAGICFFSASGMLMLCNARMEQLAQALCGRDLQHLSELRQALRHPAAPVRLAAENTCVLPGGAVWRFELTDIADGGAPCTQVTAYNVTELYRVQEELRQDTEKQRRLARRLGALRTNVLTLAREEETLDLKMRIHDDVGRGVIATRKLLEQGRSANELDMSVWRSAVSVLQADTAPREKTDAMAQLRGAAEALGVRLCIEGDMPRDEAAAYVLIAALRECVTNCVRHARGSEVRMRVETAAGEHVARITNNGLPPQGEIAEGGGLTSLRRRVERSGGVMRVAASPAFALEIRLPMKGDEP